jgi:anti-anti-sigma factor
MSKVTVAISALSGVDKGHTITISGQLDETNVDNESKKIYELLEKEGEGAKLLFNFKDLKYMNSKSVGYLADWHGKLAKAKGNMVIVNAADNIMEVLSVVGLDSIIEVVDSMDKAKKALK